MENNLLVAARAEYTEQLQDILCSTIYAGIKNVWDTCKENPETPNLKLFQQKLCMIPGWNQEIINKYYTNSLNSEVSAEYLDKIIEAVFLSNVKILSVVKLQNKKQSIDVSVPNTKHFIHKCFIEVAREFYKDPHLIDDRDSVSNTSEIQRNIKRSFRIIRECVEKTIRNMIPMEEILNKYLEAQHSESDSDQEPEPIREPTPEPIREPTPEPIREPTPEPTEPRDEFMNQPGDVSGHELAEEDIFSREPEKITVKLNEPISENSQENFFSDSDSDHEN